MQKNRVHLVRDGRCSSTTASLLREYILCSLCTPTTRLERTDPRFRETCTITPPHGSSATLLLSRPTARCFSLSPCWVCTPVFFSSATHSHRPALCLVFALRTDCIPVDAAGAVGAMPEHGGGPKVRIMALFCRATRFPGYSISAKFICDSNHFGSTLQRAVDSFVDSVRSLGLPPPGAGGNIMSGKNTKKKRSY